jgi:hypothetical protein
MHIDDLIYQALLDTHKDDMTLIRHYVQWVKIRRAINRVFYSPPVHWVRSSRRAHWVGR